MDSPTSQESDAGAAHLEVGLALEEHLLDLDGDTLAGPHGAQLSEPAILDNAKALQEEAAIRGKLDAETHSVNGCILPHMIQPPLHMSLLPCHKTPEDWDGKFLPGDPGSILSRFIRQIQDDEIVVHL